MNDDRQRHRFVPTLPSQPLPGGRCGAHPVATAATTTFRSLLEGRHYDKTLHLGIAPVFPLHRVIFLPPDVGLVSRQNASMLGRGSDAAPTKNH